MIRIAAGIALIILGAKFASAQDTRDASKALKVTMGVTATGRDLPVLVAREKKYFAEAGLDVDLNVFKSDREGVESFLAGNIDAISLSSVDAFAAESKAPGTLLFLTGQYDDSINLVLPNGSLVRSYQDLKGRRIATLPHNGAVGLLKMLLKSKLGSSDAAAIVEMDFAAIEKSIDSKSVDAAFLSDYHVARFRERGIHGQLSDRPLSAVWWPIFTGGCAVRTTLLKRNPEEVHRLYSALEKAVHFLWSGFGAGCKEATLLARKYTGFSEVVHKEASLDSFFTWDGGQTSVGSEQRTRSQALARTLQLLRDAGVIDERREGERDIDLDAMFYIPERKK